MTTHGIGLAQSYFDQRGDRLAANLLGKVLRRKVLDQWLSALIIDTEAYLVGDKASHSWLGRTPSREPMFMSPGTIYMYHSRGGDSLNISCRGAGSAVLIKSGWPYTDQLSPLLSLVEDIEYRPKRIIVARRLGIRPEHDAHRLLRFIDEKYVDSCTSNPLKKRRNRRGADYRIIRPKSNVSPGRAEVDLNR